jgi:alpha-ribazole phosphatase
MATSLWLVRHATPLVAAGVCYGRLDVAADPRHTASAAAALAAALPAGVKVVSSPLLRCRQLAEALTLLRPDVSLDHDARLAEMDFGDWEGRRWADLGAETLERWTADFANFAPGGGEPVIAFMTRVGCALDSLEPGVETVWITHAGVIRAAGLIAAGHRTVSSATEWPSAEIEFGSWRQLRRTQGRD